MDIQMGERLIKFGLNVAYYRKLKNINQETLAEKAKLSRSQISNIEAANVFANPTLLSIFNISEALEIPASKLLELRDE